EDAIDALDAAGRADPARGALAATFNRAKFHREPRHLRHVDRIVENDEAAMANEPVAGRESLVVVGRIEHRSGEISAKRPAALDRPHRPPGMGAAADPVA